MRTTIIRIIGAAFLLTRAQADVTEYDYSKLSPEQQKPWGYSVRIIEGKEPSLQLEIPAQAAKRYRGARLLILDEQKGIVADISMALIPNSGGSLTGTIKLAGNKAHATLYVFTDPVPDAVVRKDFNGFFFRLGKPQ